MLNLETFYIIISPEQDSAGKILINRRLGELRNWYFCSQEYNKADELDRQVLQIANEQRIQALIEAYHICGFEGEFQLAKPKSCNENAAKRYMSGRIVIILDEFDIEDMTCKIHNGLLCRSIDDDPRIWRKENSALPFCSIIGVPVLDFDEEVLGALFVQCNRENVFDEIKDTFTLSYFGKILAIIFIDFFTVRTRIADNQKM